MVFSKRLVLVYTFIVIVPLFILVIALTNVSRRNQYDELRKKCVEDVENNFALTQKYTTSYDLIESMICANGKLLLFFARPDADSETEMIDTIHRETLTIERLLFVMPDIYAIRLFSENPIIPERWPVFLKMSRASLNTLNRFEYNYRATYMGGQISLMDSSVCTTRPLIKNRQMLGYLQVTMRMKDFFPYLYKVHDENESDYVFKIDSLASFAKGKKIDQITNSEISKFISPLTHREEEIIKSDMLQSYNSVSNSMQSGVVTISEGRWEKIAAWKFVPEMNIAIIHTSSTKSLYRVLLIFRLSIAFGLSLTAVVLFLIIRYTTAHLMSGVYSVMNGMKQVQAGYFDVTLKVDASDDVGEAEQAFNDMASRLRSQIEQIKTEQNLIADTEMKAMQNQINAHFLYNVLETIRMQAVLADENEIAESVHVLGNMMRYCLKWRVHRVSVEQEIEYIRSYIYILNMRNDYKISLETDIEEDYIATEIPKMTLQPLIENAFTHAIESKGIDAVIKVSASLSSDGSCIELKCTDYGCGMSEEKLESIRSYLSDEVYERDSFGGIGLKNIQQRLNVFYGKEYRVRIESKENCGTTVTVPVPLKKDSTNS